QRRDDCGASPARRDAPLRSTARGCVYRHAADRAGTPREAHRPWGGENQHGPSLVAVFLLRRRWTAGVRPEAPRRDETCVARHPDGSEHLRARAGTCCPIAGEQGARAALRLRAPSHEGCPVWQVARVRPPGHRTFLCLAPPFGRDAQEHPAEAHRPGDRLALPQRAQEGAEGVAKQRRAFPVPRRQTWCRGQRGALACPPRSHTAPHQGVQPTPSSLCSCRALSLRISLPGAHITPVIGMPPHVYGYPITICTETRSICS